MAAVAKLDNCLVRVHTKELGDFYALKNSESGVAFLNPMRSCDLVSLRSTDVVVDIGAYIGEFSMRACRIAKSVTAYEASPRTFKILQMNLTRASNVTSVNAAIVGSAHIGSSVTLYLSKGIGVTNSIAKTQLKAQAIGVPAKQFDEAVRKASVVKIDVEGAEYSYGLPGSIHDGIRALILEFHPMSTLNQPWRYIAEDIMDGLARLGFHCLLRPKFKNGWDTNSTWVRD